MRHVMLFLFQLNFCNVSITDDGIYEPRESFSVWLSSASSDQWYGARVGENNQVRIAITNHEDGETHQMSNVVTDFRRCRSTVEMSSVIVNFIPDLEIRRSHHISHQQ